MHAFHPLDDIGHPVVEGLRLDGAVGYRVPIRCLVLQFEFVGCGHQFGQGVDWITLKRLFRMVTAYISITLMCQGARPVDYP